MTDMTNDGVVGDLGLDDVFLRRLEQLALSARRTAGAVGGRPGHRRTPAADFVDHRPYSPGDDERHIDWPAVARTDEVFVKVGRAPQAANVNLLLDTSASIAVCPEKRRLTRQLGAALGWMSLMHGDKLRLVPFPPSPSHRVWGPASGGSQCGAFLDQLARIPWSASADTSLGPAVKMLARQTAVGGLCVVISDLWVSDDLGLALGALPSPQWDLYVMHVLDRDELEPDFDGPLQLRDAESGEELQIVVDAAVRQAYRTALSERIERVRSHVSGTGGRHVLIPADWPFERAVIPYLQRQAIIRS